MTRDETVTTAGPDPAVSLPAGGGSVSDEAPGSRVEARGGEGVAAAPLLATGERSVSAEGTTGSNGSATSAASVATVDALSGTLLAVQVGSTCRASTAGASGATTLSGGALRTSETETVDLPATPAPGTTFSGTTAAGEAFTVILNEQQTQGSAITVTAVHISLHGPMLAGHIELAQTRCEAATGAEPATGLNDGDAPGSTAEPARVAVDRPVGDAPVSAAIVGTSPLFAAQQATGLSGLAFNYYTNVGLFGGPAALRGYGQPASAPASAASPSVTCPAGGGNPSVTDPDGARSTYGPATIFGGIWPDENNVAPPSGPLTSSIECRLGENGFVTATTRVTRNPANTTWTTPGGTTEAWPGGVGPDPFHADAVTSTCTKRADGTTTASTTITNGVLVTSTDAATQAPKTQQDVPTSPPVNYTREGTIDHVGDRWRIVFNEQTTAADGTITVNAVHMYLLGAIAVGDQVIGQVRCGLTAAQTPTSTSSTTTAGTSSSTAAAGGGSTASSTTGPASGTGSGTVAAPGT
ncbi:MAG: choice-of-anchor P family protein, partial [Acidimicrobiales bacterium]